MSTLHRNLAVAGVLLVAAVASVGSALAGSTKSTVKAATNTAPGKKVVVDAKGRTLYRLSGETKSALKCTSTVCLGAWPPLTVSSAKTKLVAGTGVHGKLTLLHRAGGVLQVMLGGKPLYRFVGDKTVGDTVGNNIKSFGGTWNVLSAGAATSTTPTPTTTTPASGNPAPIY
jgi:predicted lipoprotein with Yx(FWY)xxD motif